MFHLACQVGWIGIIRIVPKQLEHGWKTVLTRCSVVCDVLRCWERNDNPVPNWVINGPIGFSIMVGSTCTTSLFFAGFFSYASGLSLGSLVLKSCSTYMWYPENSRSKTDWRPKPGLFKAALWQCNRAKKKKKQPRLNFAFTLHRNKSKLTLNNLVSIHRLTSLTPGFSRIW